MQYFYAIILSYPLDVIVVDGFRLVAQVYYIHCTQK